MSENTDYKKEYLKEYDLADFEHNHPYKAFPYVYSTDPIDFWAGAQVVSELERLRVLASMPEMPRGSEVYAVTIPSPPELAKAYLCKADNNGIVYIFCDSPLFFNIFQDVDEGERVRRYFVNKEF